ncbi:MAG TPA: hypothetical protein VJ624_09255, partial [Thermodesulfobacteriota bacterium]|nr:hypothetical protein [Thermodesulfobacteriota bacterium]
QVRNLVQKIRDWLNDYFLIVLVMYSNIHRELSLVHLYIFVGSSSYSSTSIPRRRLDLLLNATWY